MAGSHAQGLAACLTLPSEEDCAIAEHGDYPEPQQPGTRQERLGWYRHGQITAQGGRRRAMGEALTIRVRRDRDYAVLAVAGEGDIATGTRPRERLVDLEARGPRPAGDHAH